MKIIVALIAYSIILTICVYFQFRTDRERDKYISLLEMRKGIVLSDAKMKIYYDGQPFEEYENVKAISEDNRSNLIRIEYGKSKVKYLDKEFVTEIRIVQ